MVKLRPRTPTAPEQSGTDAGLFRDAVSDVTPLVHTPPAAGLAKRPPRARVRKDPAVLAAALADSASLDRAAPGESPELSVEVTSEGALSFSRPGIGEKTLRKLRRGLYPVEDELDLHGHHQSAARDRLAAFIARSRAGGCRCVRIIHGKGYRSGVRGPILKSAVNIWLRRHLDVIAFVSARPIDGGAGALYVLLRQ